MFFNNNQKQIKKVFLAEPDTSGLYIVDQSGNGYEIANKGDGILTIIQEAATGYGDSGSGDNATLFLFENPLNEDFSMSLDIEATTVGTSGRGIFSGAFSGIEADSPFTSVAFRGNNGGTIVGFGYKKSGTSHAFGTTGTSGSLSTGEVYSIEFSRNGDVFTGTVVHNGSQVTSYTINMASNEVAEMLSGTPLYPGFSVIGASVKVSNWLIKDSSGDILFDSSKIWEDKEEEVPPVDWEEVVPPQLSNPVILSERPEFINLEWELAVGNGYADSIDIVVSEVTQGEVATIRNTSLGLSGTACYLPAASGTYTFTAYAVRTGEITKAGNTVGPIDFKLLLKAPVAQVRRNGTGLIIQFTQVAEAETYTIKEVSQSQSLFVIEGNDTTNLPLGVTFANGRYTAVLTEVESRLYQFEIIVTNADGDSVAVSCEINLIMPSREAVPLTYDEIGDFLEANLMVPMDASVGSSKITRLHVPNLAYDDTSITVVWEKPEKYDNIADYNVYINGILAGSARENFAVHADWADAYMKAFYQGYQENPDIEMVKVDIHTFRATNLIPETVYQFEVRAIDNKGNEIDGSSSGSISQATTAVPDIFDITDFGAVPVAVGLVSYDEEANQLIEANTKAIQKAIDVCSQGGKVVIPEGIFVTGAIYLKSNITLELSEGAILWGSPNVDHYDQNYLLYPYSTDTRSWALVNAYSADENGMIKNIRITGKGTIYGNGWKYGTKDEISGSGYEPYYTEKDALDPIAPIYDIEEWVAGSNSKVLTYGVLAADASRKGQEHGLTASQAYSKRPNLVVLRGVDGIYLEDFYAKNPAFHTIALLDSKNIVSNNIKYITYDANNADGIEIGNSQNALVFNNFFDTGDDSVNFATGLGKGVQDSKQHPSEKIWTFNNFIRNGHGGAIAAGSHTGAGIYSMLVEDNVINLNEMPFRFKSNAINGGGVSNVVIRDCAVANCRQLFTYTTAYSDANQVLSVEPANQAAEFTNIKVYQITADNMSKNTFEIIADVKNNYNPWHTHRNMYYQDMTLINSVGSESIKGVENVVFDNVKITAPNRILWSSVSYSWDLQFINGTSTSEGSERAEHVPVWIIETDASGIATTAVSQKIPYDTAAVTLAWHEVYNEDDGVFYLINTYVNGELVDESEKINQNSYTITDLSPGVTYTFEVIAWTATGNPAVGPKIIIVTPAAEENGHVNGSDELSAVEIVSGSVGYTWATAKFENGYFIDRRIRGYHIYTNGVLQQTLYNYQIRDAYDATALNIVLKRLKPSVINEVKIVAFTDSGLEYRYQTVLVETLENYDYHAPVWSADAKIWVSGQTADGKLILSWDEATDPSGICGYRLYVDGMPVLGNHGKNFNDVNGEYTTEETTYIVDVNVDDSHQFRVEAGDNWWRAVDGSGPYHWTFSGPVLAYDGTL